MCVSWGGGELSKKAVAYDAHVSRCSLRSFLPKITNSFTVSMFGGGGSSAFNGGPGGVRR